MTRWLGFGGVLVLVIAAATACGGSDDDASSDEGDTGTPTLELVVVGKDERFSPITLEAPAGNISIKFDNEDEGVLHNIRLYRGTDADGQFIRKSDLQRGAATDVLKVKLEPGTYFYDCEVHPASMTGTLTVR